MEPIGWGEQRRRALRRAGTEAPSRLRAEKERAGDEEHGGKILRCRSCGAPITTDEERTVIAGGSVHDRVNPAGIRFRFGCFRSAAGALVVGGPTSEHTWFPGYSWSFALCAACRVHLGWHFQGPGLPSFFGLIVDRLAEGEADS